MRKTVIDGSNTSGFQRTVLIAHDGFVDTSFGNVRVATVCLEEDSARLISREKNKSVYRLDRLGIPLVEIATYPDLRNAEQVKECALKLGEILRACRVKRGIGTIRQDVNISVSGHDRVEIKGFQDPKMMITTIDKEIERQLLDLKNKKLSGNSKGARDLLRGDVRNALPDGSSEFLRPMPGASRMYPETDLPLLRIGLEKVNRIKKNLPKLKSDIRDELKKKGLTDEMIKLVLSENYYFDSFENLLNIYSKDANLIAKMVVLWREEIATKTGKTIDGVMKVLHERVLEQILELVRDGKLENGDVKSVMMKIAEGVKFSDAVKIDKISDDEVEIYVREIVKEKPGMRANAYMGMVMAKFKGKIDAKKAMEIIDRVVGK